MLVVRNEREQPGRDSRAQTHVRSRSVEMSNPGLQHIPEVPLIERNQNLSPLLFDLMGRARSGESVPAEATGTVSGAKGKAAPSRRCHEMDQGDFEPDVRLA